VRVAKNVGWNAEKEGQGMNDAELIKAYIKESANETSHCPFGAEARRKVIGDELIARGITEFRLPAFGRSFPVRGSDKDAPKIAYKLVGPE
jgi:hypothetical protein